MDVEKLFNDLESNNIVEYKDAKKTLAEYFNQTKEQWYVQGMMEYYLKTNSIRILEVIVKVQSPHDIYIFDRLSEWLRGQNRVPALTLFGFIVREHPTWLYKVAKHKLIRDILKLLQTEKEIVPLMSALLCIITLLPIIPLLVPNFLSDLFEVFGHLASWNCQNPSKLSENQLIHLQIGLYMLFHRLYGMYPCHFISYLRDFIVKEKGAIFQHTIKPLLETVRMHPMLVTATKESEINNVRWKEMEPHDVVVECAKLSLEYCQESTDCLAAVTSRSQDSYTADTPLRAQLQASLHQSPFQKLGVISSPFHSLIQYEKNGNFQKFENIWSPSIEILSTPPPTGTVPHTPTPSLGVPLTTNSSSVLGGTGASPPEAAVEATPETTPMKDINLRKAKAANSSAVRSILISSQPSSPMRKEQSPFSFPDTCSTSSKVIQMIQDRHQFQLHSIGRLNSVDNSRQLQQTSPSAQLNSQDIQYLNTSSKSGLVVSLDSPTSQTETTQDDQEVTELTNQQIGPHHSDTLQDISNECDDCEETERSPCSAGGLHVPTNRSMRILANGIRRNRMASYCHNDTSCYLSYGTSPADVINVELRTSVIGNAELKKAKSWPIIERRVSLDENSAEADITVSQQNQDIMQQNGDSSSPSGDDAISAATHFKKLQQKRDRKLLLVKHFEEKNISFKASCGTQTIQQWPPLYEYNLLELFAEDNKLRSTYSTNTMQPCELLDKYIERIINMKQSIDAKYSEEMLKDQIHLLQLQLQYERYRREIHAERNRRLLGKNRATRSLEMDNDKLHDQLEKFQNDVQNLTMQLNASRKDFNEREQELLKELNLWKSKYQTEVDNNRQLRSDIENLQRRLNEESKNRKEIHGEIEALRGELSDMRNHMEQAQHQVELGLHYKQQLARLEAEFMVMGEVQVKCSDKLKEIDNIKAKDEEIRQLRETYNEEIRDLRCTFDDKSSQLESAKHRLGELQTQLSNKEVLFTDQKRLLKTVKDEYEEKFKALDTKYEAQKKIILQMEEKILELSKHQMAVNQSTFFPELSDKTDLASSLEYNSPLSASLASNEGLSVSLCSVPEHGNLQPLVGQTNTASVHAVVTAPISSTICSVSSVVSTKKCSTSQQCTYQHTTNKQSTRHTTKTSIATTVLTSTTSPLTSSSVASSSRQTAASLDIPFQGSSQQHAKLRHHYSTHHR